MKEKNTLQKQREMYSMMFGDSGCPVNENCTLEEIEQSIEECKSMLTEAISRSDKDEISYWRKLLQENKVHRREILNT